MTTTMGETGSPPAGSPPSGPRAGAPQARAHPARSHRAAGGRADNAVDVRGLTKRYGRRTAVAGLDIVVPTGVVAGFVGPNGAGKTTTLRMLLGLVRPTGGAGTVLGHPLGEPARYLPRVGALIESPALYPALSGERNLASLSVLGGQDPARVGAILDEVGLSGRGGDKVRTYSLGMKQRLAIGAALLSNPDLLILDEPTNGLDPTGIRQMRDLIRSIATGPSAAGRSSARTVLISSHLLAEVEQICDWLIVVDGGRLAYQGPTDQLMAEQTHDVALRPEHEEDVPLLADILAGFALPVTRQSAEVVVSLTGAQEEQPGDGPRKSSGQSPDDAPERGQVERDRVLAHISRAAAARGVTLVEMSPRRLSLEDRYQGLVAQSRHRSAGAPVLPEPEAVR